MLSVTNCVFFTLLWTHYIVLCSAILQKYDDAVKNCLNKLGFTNIYFVEPPEVHRLDVCILEELGIQKENGKVDLSIIAEVIFQALLRMHHENPHEVPKLEKRNFEERLKSCENLKEVNKTDMLEKVQACIRRVVSSKTVNLHNNF